MDGSLHKAMAVLSTASCIARGETSLITRSRQLEWKLHLVQGVECIKDGVGVIVASLGPEVVSIPAAARMLTVQEMAVIDPGHLTNTGHIR